MGQLCFIVRWKGGCVHLGVAGRCEHQQNENLPWLFSEKQTGHSGQSVSLQRMFTALITGQCNAGKNNSRDEVEVFPAAGR